jgi:hypothetical protein
MTTCSQCGKPKLKQPHYLCDDCIKPFPVLGEQCSDRSPDSTEPWPPPSASDLVERLRDPCLLEADLIATLDEAADTIENITSYWKVSKQGLKEAADTIQRLEAALEKIADWDVLGDGYTDFCEVRNIARDALSRAALPGI